MALNDAVGADLTEPITSLQCFVEKKIIPLIYITEG